MSLKDLIHITNPHIKNPRVMMTVKSGGFYFFWTRDTKACNTHLEMKLRSQMVIASEITIQNKVNPIFFM